MAIRSNSRTIREVLSLLTVAWITGVGIAQPMQSVSEEPEAPPTANAPARPTTGMAGMEGMADERTKTAESSVTVTEVALAGPRVPDRVGRSIVKRDAKGNFQRISGRPEAAVLALLTLDNETRDRARRVMDDRAVSVGVLLIERLEETKAIGDSIEGNDRERTDALMRELYASFDPLKLRSPMMAELAQVLSLEEFAEFTKIEDEYWEMWLQWELRSKKPKDRTPEACRKTEERLAFGLFQDEVRRAYDATFRPYRQKLDKLFEAVEPLPEQREAITKLVIGYLRNTRMQATVDQRRELLQSVYKALDEDRRAKLFDVVAREVAAGTW